LRRCKLLEHNFEYITVRGRFSKKKLLTKFSSLATSGLHNSTMITDRRKFTTKLTLYAMSSSFFTVRINSKSFPWAVHTLRTANIPPKFSATSDVGYCYAAVLVLLGYRYMEEK